MTDTKETTDKTAATPGAAGKKPLSLKGRVDTGMVHQSFSHGRRKAVVVETVKKKRPIGAPSADSEELKAPTPRPAAPGATAVANVRHGPLKVADPNDNLSVAEREARKRVLEVHKQLDHEKRAKEEQEAHEQATAAQQEAEQQAQIEAEKRAKDAEVTAKLADADVVMRPEARLSDSQPITPQPSVPPPTPPRAAEAQPAG